MCGIFCCISRKADNCNGKSNQWMLCKNFIVARGPDDTSEECIILDDTWAGHFAASVLWMQGAKTVSQPAIDSDGNILLWNGDVFSGSLASNEVCDTIAVMNAFKSSSDIMSVLSTIQGPYSFVYYQKLQNLLYFGRDKIGRHSLLAYWDYEKDSLCLTSVGCIQMTNIVEVPAIGIFKVDLLRRRLNYTCYPWKEPDLQFSDSLEGFEWQLGCDIDIEKSILSSDPSIFNDLHLHPNKEDIEYLEMSYTGDPYETLRYLYEKTEVRARVERLSELLHNAVELRVKKQPNCCSKCIKILFKGKDEVTCTHSAVGILFSGGLDSAILALIADKYVPEYQCIDLINVAFENFRKSRETEDVYDVPDRRTGKQTFQELTRLCPNREWNFVEVNVTREELSMYRTSRIKHLLYPRCSILDDSLGSAIWFASRARGVLLTTDTPYESHCRILLLGMGADELFGGYMRHRTTLRHKGWPALTEELSIELARISERNLGRDDRVVSDHSRQSRLPYLDENVVEYVQKLKSWERCYPTDKMPCGIGDKLLLRLVAYKLGFENTACFAKRAFQFGSRIACSKENAKDISQRL